MTKQQIANDAQLWKELQSHNEFLGERLRSLSACAYKKNNDVMKGSNIPNWDQQEWREAHSDVEFASNVSVTWGDFYNRNHRDKADINPFTYGLFAYINPQTGEVIPPPSNERGHGLMFPHQACIVDYAESNGIVEVVWETTKFHHYTTKPPDSLKTTNYSTHFGCSLQINETLAAVAKRYMNKTDEEVKNATNCKEARELAYAKREAKKEEEKKKKEQQRAQTEELKRKRQMECEEKLALNKRKMQ